MLERLPFTSIFIKTDWFRTYERKLKKIECQVDRERNLVDLRALYKISSKNDYFLVFCYFLLLLSRFFTKKEKTWLPWFRPELLPIFTEWSEFNWNLEYLEQMASTIDSFQAWSFFVFLIFFLFFVCIFSSFFFIFPFFISSCTVQCVTFLIFLVGAWLCTSKGKIQWCIKLLSAHHQGPTSSVNKACYKS